MTNVLQLAEMLGGQVCGNGELVIEDAQSIENAGPHDVTFVVGEKNLRTLSKSDAGAVIISNSLTRNRSLDDLRKTFVCVEDAQRAFIEVLTLLRSRRPRPLIGVSPRAFVSPSAQIGENTNVYPGAYVDHDVIIGHTCDLYPGVYIGPGCRLGNHVTLFSNVVLYADVILGDRVTLQASAVIGADGFGYRFVNGRHEKIPHFGSVRVGDDVDVGACTTIDRAMIGETVVGSGTKIDNLVMIAHNCELGRHNAIVAQVGFAGSVTTGDYVICAGQAGVVDHVHLGERCVVGSKAGVCKDIPAGETQYGIPSQPAEVIKKVTMVQRKLPQMRTTVRKLEAQVAELTEKLEQLSATKSAASRPAA